MGNPTAVRTQMLRGELAIPLGYANLPWLLHALFAGFFADGMRQHMIFG